MHRPAFHNPIPFTIGTGWAWQEGAPPIARQPGLALSVEGPTAQAWPYAILFGPMTLLALLLAGNIAIASAFSLAAVLAD